MAKTLFLISRGHLHQLKGVNEIQQNFELEKKYLHLREQLGTPKNRLSL